MIKKIITSVALLIGVASFAQEGTSSPYSFYGIGDVRFKGTVENNSMAGVAVEQDSIHMNLENPASFANLKLTTFAVGGNFNLNNLKEGSNTDQAKRTTFDYMAVGLPMGKWGVGFGLFPYSSVGYKIEDISQADGVNNKRYNGTGGLNKVFFGVAYKLHPSLSIGADVNYNFGNIKTNTLEFATAVPFGTRELNSADLSGANFNLGAMYQTKISSKLNFFSSLSYTLESKLSSHNSRLIGIGTYSATYDFSPTEAGDQEYSDTKLTLPSELKLGAGIGQPRKWLIGAQIAMGSIGDLVNTYNGASNVQYEKTYKYRLGGYYVPNYNSFTSYFERVVYRAGLKYDKTGLVVNSQSIKDVAFDLGFGFPVSGTFSNMNLGIELGKKGTTSAGLVSENYTNFSVGFSLNDRWFVKRKYN